MYWRGCRLGLDSIDPSTGKLVSSASGEIMRDEDQDASSQRLIDDMIVWNKDTGSLPRFLRELGVQFCHN